MKHNSPSKRHPNLSTDNQPQTIMHIKRQLWTFLNYFKLLCTQPKNKPNPKTKNQPKTNPKHPNGERPHLNKPKVSYPKNRCKLSYKSLSKLREKTKAPRIILASAINQNLLTPRSNPVSDHQKHPELANKNK